jgi:signal transduction histidine kinase
MIPEASPPADEAAHWETFAREVAPRVMGRHAPNTHDVRVWIAGCGGGALAYVVTAALLRAGERAHHRGQLRVIASASAADAVATARRGAFSPELLRRAPDEIWESADIESWPRMRDKLRKHILFTQHRLGVDPPFGRCDLVYLAGRAGADAGSPEAITAHLVFALRDGGLLFAAGERLPIDVDAFGVVRGRLYRKIDSQLHRHEIDEIINDVVEAERLRISAELHDGVGQNVSAASLLLYRLRQASGSISAEVDALCADLTDVLTAIRQDLRAVARGELVVLDVSGTTLPAALAESVSNVATMLDMQVETSCSGSYEWLDEATATHLVHIAQEAIRNAGAAHAKHAVVSLQQSDREMQLEIRDDGPGLPGGTLGPFEGVGIRIMRHRARAIRGQLRLWSDEHGTHVTCRIDRS